MENIEAYPLHWPVGYPRTTSPERSRFKTTQNSAQIGLMREINMLGGRNVIISTNIPLRRDGMPYATYNPPQDKGVAVYFTYNKQQVVFACDKWSDIADNIQAIRKTVEAVRMMPQWGVSDMLNRTFAGFKALAETNERSCWQVLGIEPTTDPAAIRRAFIEKSRIHHPDNGGSNEQMQELNLAYEVAKAIK